jgi:hypothetical protein
MRRGDRRSRTVPWTSFEGTSATGPVRIGRTRTADDG